MRNFSEVIIYLFWFLYSGQKKIVKKLYNIPPAKITYPQKSTWHPYLSVKNNWSIATNWKKNNVLSITRLLSSVLYITCKDFMIGKKLYKNAATILMTLSNENCFCFFRSSIQNKAKFGLLGVCGCRVQNNNFSSSACI